MKKTAILLAATVFALGFTSCKKKGCTDPTASNYSEEAKKDDGSCVFDDPYTADFKSFFQSYRDEATQTFSIDPTIWNEVTGTNGTRLQIPANSFVDASGTPVTSSVDIALLEVLDQSSMILMGLPTTSGNEILISGGELNVEATSGGSDVFLATGTSIGLLVPTASPDPEMDIFEGTEESDGSVTWSLTADSTTVVSDSTWGDYYYYDWGKTDLGWINCDYFYSDPNPKSDLTVNVSGPADHTFDNTQVMVHFTTLSSVASGYPISSDPDEDSFLVWNLPEGLELTVIGISEVDGSYYSAFVPLTMTLDAVQDITLSPTTTADFEAAVLSL